MTGPSRFFIALVRRSHAAPIRSRIDRRDPTRVGKIGPVKGGSVI